MDCSFIFLWSWAYLCEEKMKKQNSNWSKKQHNRNEVKKQKRNAKRRLLNIQARERRMSLKKAKKKLRTQTDWNTQKIVAGDKTAITEE